MVLYNFIPLQHSYRTFTEGDIYRDGRFPLFYKKIVVVSDTEFKQFRMGRCLVFVSIDGGNYHLSISTPDKLPSYEEMKEARYKFCPDEIYMAEIFPPKSEFINVHPYCRHLWQIDIDKSNYPKK